MKSKKISFTDELDKLIRLEREEIIYRRLGNTEERKLKRQQADWQRRIVEFRVKKRLKDGT